MVGEKEIKGIKNNIQVGLSAEALIFLILIIFLQSNSICLYFPSAIKSVSIIRSLRNFLQATSCSSGERFGSEMDCNSVLSSSFVGELLGLYRVSPFLF